MTAHQTDNRRVPDCDDETLSVLSTPCNRDILEYLERTDEDAVSLETLAAHVASEAASSDLSCPEQAASRLHHLALPRMADAELLNYDGRRHVVSDYRSVARVDDTVDRVFVDV